MSTGPRPSSKLTRWPTTHHATDLTSLDDYVGRMKEGQDAIYYVTGETREALTGSPHLEALRAREYEVLLMTDPVDTWAAEGLHEYGGKKLVNAMRADVKLPDEKKDEQADKEIEPLVNVRSPSKRAPTPTSIKPTSTRRPRAERALANATATVDLPTPPLPLVKRNSRSRDRMGRGQTEDSQRRRQCIFIRAPMG